MTGQKHVLLLISKAIFKNLVNVTSVVHKGCDQHSNYFPKYSFKEMNFLSEFSIPVSMWSISTQKILRIKMKRGMGIGR